MKPEFQDRLGKRHSSDGEKIGAGCGGAGDMGVGPRRMDCRESHVDGWGHARKCMTLHSKAQSLEGLASTSRASQERV